MNEFLIELQAILDQEKSKGNISKSIIRIQNKLDKLKVQVEIDPKTILNLTKKIEKITNQKITFSNINVDTGQAVKNAQKAAQQIANASVSAADTVIQNEERKQQAYKQTADIQKQILAGESLIKSGANVMMFDNTNDAAQKASQYFRELLQDEQALISVSEKFNKANQLSTFTVNVKRATGEVETLKYALENIGKNSDPFYVFKNIGAVLNDSTAIKQVQKMEKVITDYETKLNDFKTRYSKTNIDFSGFETVFNNFRNGIGTVNDLKIAFNQLENSAKASTQMLKSQSSSLDPITQALNNMRDLQSTLQTLQTNMSGLQNKTALAGISVDDLISRYMKLKAEMDAAGGKVPLDGSWAREYQKLMSDVVSATKRVTAEQKKVEKSTNSFFASLKKNFSFLSYWTSANYIFMTSIRKIKEMVSSVRELESALVNINYTMELSGRQLKEIGKSSLQMAKDMNTSASNVLSAVKLYANAKESAESILKKSQPAIMISNVTEMTGENAAKMLQSIMNQFDMTQDDLMEIADTIEMVSQNMAYDFASGIDEIASGIEQSGSVAKSAGLSLQEYVSMLGLVIEKTGQSGSTIGNAYKTILQRITKASAMEGTLEEDISAAEKSLRAVGVEVRNTADEFRDLTDIMSDLGKVWDSLSSVEQSNISYNVAGVRQTNILKSLLGYWEDYESLVEKANDASGTTLKNQEIYVESLQGKLGKLSAIWSNISNDTISSNFLKGLADAGIGISSIIEKIGLLKSVIASVGIAAFVKNFNHLKEVGASISALNEIQRVFNNTALVGEQLNLSLAGSLSTYSVETVKAAIAQGTFTAEQIKAILTAKGLTDAEIQEVITTNALTASQTGATASTFGLGTAFKGLGLSIKTATKSMIAWMATNPIGWITAVVSAIGASIYGVVKLHDALTVSLEEQKEKLQETKEAYENVKNELQEVETELQNTQNKVEELENTPNLTWVDQEELNRLREVTKELELQKQLKQDAQLESAKDLYKENEKTFDKEFKSSYGNTSVSDLKEQLSSGQIGIGQLDYKNITDIVTALQYINEEKAKLTDESEIAEFEDFINDLTDLIKSDGQEYLSSLSEYKQNILEIASIRDLTQDEQDFYDYLSSMQKAIYEYYSPAAWNNLEFDSIFDTEGIEKTKEELVSMYKSGELSSAEMLEQFPKLNQAIKESEIIAGESSDVYKEFFNEIAALAEGQADVVNDVMEETKASLSITETVDQINTQLKPAFDSLKSAYEDIFSLNEDTGEKLFSLDDVDINTFESIRAQLEKLGEIDGITIDYSPFERFVSVLSDTSSTAEEVQQQFDNLATSIIYTTDCTNMSAETYDLLVKSLTEMGVTNADEVLTNLKDIQEELVSLGYDVANITAEEAAELIRLGAVSAETTEYLKMYLIQKQLAQNPLNTMADITALEGLCNALGVTGELYRYVIDLKRAFDAKEMGAVSDGLDSSIEHIKGKIQELANGQADFQFNFSAPGTSKKSGSSSSSKSEKDTTKEFDWIEQAIENVEKEVKKLDDVVNSAYSTFSQKNEALAQEIGKVSKEIDLQQQAYDEYMRKADSIGLSDHYKELVQSGAINIEDIADENLQKQIDAYQKWYDKAQNAADAIKELKTDMKDLYVSAYELQTDNLKERLDSDSITQKQYLDGLKAAYEQFYANLEDFAQQYHEAVLEYLDEEKSYLNDVAGAAASLLDREIDNVRDDADEQENRLKRQIDLLEDRKKPLEDELKALEDKAKKENLIYNLQKAQYDLARAEYQRPKLVYSEEKGLHYTNDPQAVRDAKKDVDDAKLEIQKQSIQDQIDALDDEIDRYNVLIDQINKAADDQIDALEKIKNKWQEVIDQQEYAKNISLLTGEFGTDAITKILTGNDDDLLAQWKDNYINTLAGIDMESQGYIGNMTEQIASLYGVDLSPLQSQFMGVSDSVNGMTDALAQAANAVGIGNVTNATPNPAAPESTNAPSTNTEPSLESAIVNETETAMNAFDQHTDKLTNEVIPAIQAAAQEMNAFNESADMDIEKTITIHYETTGEKPFGGGDNIAVGKSHNVGKAHVEGTVGKAFAEGTGKYKGLPKPEKNALVSEYGQTEMTVLPDGKTIITDEPTMMDLPKDTVIFNEEQTKQIMNNKPRAEGKTYANGTVEYPDGTIITPDGHTLRPLQPGDQGWDLLQKCQPLVDKILSGQMDIVSNAVFEHQKQMEQIVKEITNNTAINNISNTKNVQPVVNNNDIHVTLPNVTNSTSADALLRDLQSIRLKSYQFFNP